MHDLILVAQVLLATVFAVAGISKLGNLAGSRTAMTEFGVPGSIAPAAALLLPLAELVVALALLTRHAWYGAAGALALLLIFIAGIGYNLARGRHPDCQCFGQLSSKPVGASTLFRNTALAALAGAVLWQGRDVADSGLIGRLGNLTGGQVAVLVAFLLVALAVAGLVWFLGSLLTQQGRILARLDALEARLDQLTAPGKGGSAAPSAPPKPVGLPIGAPAPAFRLADLTGQETGLAELLAPGLPLVLTFVDPHCGPCTSLVPDLARWSRENAGRLTLAVVSRGKPKENRAKYGDAGLPHVLMQEKGEVAERYSARATPSAVLVRPDGRVGTYVQQGTDMIKGLLKHLPSESSTGNGSGGNGAQRALGIGGRAPEIRLPDLEGRMQELKPNGKETVVLFWNPGCGFCQRMRDDIKGWEASDAPGKPDLLVVSTGTVESNRAEGFSSRVLIESGFTTASKFGASGTPSAVLVDGQGRIASGVAVGAQAVLSLVAPLEVSLS